MKSSTKDPRKAISGSRWSLRRIDTPSDSASVLSIGLIQSNSNAHQPMRTWWHIHCTRIGPIAWPAHLRARRTPPISTRTQRLINGWPKLIHRSNWAQLEGLAGGYIDLSIRHAANLHSSPHPTGILQRWICFRYVTPLFISVKTT